MEVVDHYLLPVVRGLAALRGAVRGGGRVAANNHLEVEQKSLCMSFLAECAQT